MTVCAACNKPIGEDETLVGAQGRTFHEACFVCAKCKQPFPDNTYTWNTSLSQPFHAICNAEEMDYMCAKCGEAITEPSFAIVSDDIKLHWECFTCTSCGTKLTDAFAFLDDAKTKVCCMDCKPSAEPKGDKYTVRFDRNGEEYKLYTEKGTDKKYTLEPDGTKKYKGESALRSQKTDATWKMSNS